MENTVFCLLLENKILNIVTNQAKPSVQLIIEYMKRIIIAFKTDTKVQSRIISDNADVRYLQYDDILFSVPQSGYVKQLKAYQYS